MLTFLTFLASLPQLLILRLSCEVVFTFSVYTGGVVFQRSEVIFIFLAYCWNVVFLPSEVIFNLFALILEVEMPLFLLCWPSHEGTPSAQPVMEGFKIWWDTFTVSICFLLGDYRVYHMWCTIIHAFHNLPCIIDYQSAQPDRGGFKNRTGNCFFG